MVRWRCRCPICRGIVYPILKLASITSAVRRREHESSQPSEEENISSEEGIERFARIAVRAKIETSEQIPQPPTQPQNVVTTTPQQVIVPQQLQMQQVTVQTPLSTPAPQPSPSAGSQQTTQSQQEGGGGGEGRQPEQVALPPNVTERLQQLEEELAKIKSYVKASIDGIKATLVDLRSAIAELSNPFNILRKYADIFFGEEGESRKERKEKERSETPRQSVVQPMYPVTAIPVIAYPMQAFPQSQQVQQPSTGSDGGKEVSSTSNAKSGDGRRLDVVAIERLTMWLNRALDRIGLDNVVKIIDSYVRAGILAPELGEALKSLASIVNELRKAGVPHDEQISMIVDLVRSLSSEDRDRQRSEGGEGKEKVEEESGSGAQELLKLIEGG